MKKQIFILLTLLGISQLGAETLVQIYPPISLFGFVSGKNAILNMLLIDEDAPRPSTFNLPIELRQTVAKFSFADLMTAGGLSFFFQDNALGSINLSGGLTFGYGYERGSEYFFLFRITNITLYPFYEYPLAVFHRKTPAIPWKFALDASFELIQVRPLSISAYFRVIGIYAKNRVWLGLPDCGLTLGFVF